MKIVGEGMRKDSESLDYGDLIIKFVVVFPDNLSSDRKKYLKKILPSPKKQIWDIEPSNDDAVDEVVLDYLNNDDVKNNSSINYENIGSNTNSNTNSNTRTTKYGDTYNNDINTNDISNNADNDQACGEDELFNQPVNCQTQ